MENARCQEMALIKLLVKHLWAMRKACQKFHNERKRESCLYKQIMLDGMRYCIYKKQPPSASVIWNETKRQRKNFAMTFKMIFRFKNIHQM